jgi:hypothetical protein
MEQEIIQALVTLGFKYLHRDEDNRLYASVNKPQYDRPFNQWYVDGNALYLDKFNDLFIKVDNRTKFMKLT